MHHSLLIIPLLSGFFLSILRSLENFVVEKRGIKLKDKDVGWKLRDFSWCPSNMHTSVIFSVGFFAYLVRVTPEGDK